MVKDEKAPESIDEYIGRYPVEIQEVLTHLRTIVHEAAPDVQEKMSWGIPTFVLNGNLVHFAVNKHHIGLYPGPRAVEAFGEKLAGYKTTKGTIQFPLRAPIPYDLVQEIVEFCVNRNRGK